MKKINNTKRSLLALALYGLMTPLFAATLPSNDIVIIDFDEELKPKAGIFHLTHRIGYDNQPKFSKDGKRIYFTRGFQSDDSFQTDIFSYQFDNQYLRNVSKSLNGSEYSPTPYSDDTLTIIGVADENGKQYLNQLAIDSAKQNTFTTAIEPVGYHAWLNDKEAAVFVLGDVMTLQVLHTDGNRKSMVLAENIGRCLQRVAENKISYSVDEKGKHRIYWLDGDHDSHDTGIVLPEGVQDYVWLNESEVIFGQGSKLYRMNADTKSLIVDLSKKGVNGISRLAFDKNNNRLAVVYSR